MRPHRLRLTAFGPFAGAEEVDFDALAAAGPFLLHGDTGAGKTTVLDAIGYALFGTVPGARAGNPLRSQHAADDVRTSVELWAEVGERVVHVVRRPEWTRPKRRGTGTTTENASVTVRIATSAAAIEAQEGVVLTRADEANLELRRLVGMTDQQFFQVVLLPQGDFAAFLRAKDADRGALLEQVFGTRRFRDVETWLASRRVEAAAATEAAGQRSRTAAAVLASAAGLGETDLPASDVVPWADGLQVDAREAATAAEQTLKSARAAHESAADAVGVGQTLLEARSRRSAALRRVDELAARAPEVSRLAEELARARSAVPVLGPVAHHDELVDRRDRLGHRARAALLAGGHDADLPPSVPALRSSADAALRRCGDVAALLREHEHARRARQEHERQLARIDTASSELAEAESELGLLPEALRVLTGRLAVAEHARSQVTVWTVRQDASSRALRRCDELALLLTRRATAEADDLRARASLRSAQAGYDELRRRRLEGMAAELAEQLVPGQACGVCGAQEHPAPALAGGGRVAPDDEDAAAARATAAEEHARTAGQQLAAVRARVLTLHADVLDSLQPAVDDDSDLLARVAQSPEAAVSMLADVRGLADTSETTLRGHTVLAAEHAGLVGWVATLRTRADELLAISRAATARRDDATKAAAPALATATLAESVVATGLGAARSPQEAAAAAERHAAVTARAAADVAAHEQAVLAAAEAAERVRAAAEVAGFADADDAMAAARASQWCVQADERVRGHEQDSHVVTQLLADPALIVDPDAEVDLPALLMVSGAAEESLLAAAGAWTRAHATSESVERLAGELEVAECAVVPLRHAADSARAMAELVAGGGANRLSMSLSTYVLAARLEEVCEAANTRLRTMTDGRYDLVQSDDRAKGARRAGLGLAVRDAWTGDERSAATLSGGETFLASLALALGLSDVVTAEAGGTRIDALFVDEGFGGLDARSLDRALDTLDGLRANGRMVGLVSHVEGVRQRIPVQLHVVKGSRGSTLVGPARAEAGSAPADA